MTAPAEMVKLELRDGTVGYNVRVPRRDDCWAAAVATTLQVPIDEVPDPRVDERRRGGESFDEISRSAWRELERWLARRRLRTITHRTVPAGRRRWIGVVPLRGQFNDHCLVMRGDDVLFDPSMDFPIPFVGLAGLMPGSDLSALRGITVRLWGAEDVRWGFSFQKLSKPTRRK